MNKIIAGLLFCVGLGWGQGSNTINQLMGQNIAIETYTTGNVTNIGQPYHLVFVQFHDAPGKTCSQINKVTDFVMPTLDISASFDGINYDPITNYTRVIYPNFQTANDRYRIMSSAVGSFPYVKIDLDVWDNVNCRANIFYMGSLTSLDVKKYADFNSLTDRLQTFPINIAAATDTLVVASLGVNVRVSVYAIFLFNQTMQSLTWQDLRSDASKVPIMFLTNFCAGCIQNMPNTNYPYMITSIGGSLILTTSQPTPVTGYIMFKYE